MRSPRANSSPSRTNGTILRAISPAISPQPDFCAAFPLDSMPNNAFSLCSADSVFNALKNCPVSSTCKMRFGCSPGRFAHARQSPREKSKSSGTTPPMNSGSAIWSMMSTFPCAGDTTKPSLDGTFASGSVEEVEREPPRTPPTAPPRRRKRDHPNCACQHHRQHFPRRESPSDPASAQKTSFSAACRAFPECFIRPILESAVQTSKFKVRPRSFACRQPAQIAAFLRALNL